MNSGQLTKYVFAHQGCDSCHTLSPTFQLGLTDKGQPLAKGFEGCAGLLTAMNVVGELPPADRSPDETQVAEKFQEFGCTMCSSDYSRKDGPHRLRDEDEVLACGRVHYGHLLRRASKVSAPAPQILVVAIVPIEWSRCRNPAAAGRFPERGSEPGN